MEEERERNNSDRTGREKLEEISSTGMSLDMPGDQNIQFFAQFPIRSFNGRRLGCNDQADLAVLEVATDYSQSTFQAVPHHSLSQIPPDDKDRP
jgi:hypothetical protein